MSVRPQELPNFFALLCFMQKTLLSLFLVGFVYSNGFSQVEFTSSNLPIVVVHTHAQSIGNEQPIVADMGIIYKGASNTNLLTDPFNHYDGKVAIVSQDVSFVAYPKKQYEIQLRNAGGNVMEAPILGMPAESEWILVAAYPDKSLLRDALGSRLNWWTGRYVPRFQFCEVVLNDEYMGVYILMEKIKRGPNRINLPAAGTSGNNLSGGYIIKTDQDTGSGDNGWHSTFTPPNRSGEQTIFFSYVSPHTSTIVNQQKDYIRQFITEFETSLAASNFTNPGQGYARLIDMDSFVDYLLLSEVTKNPEAYRLNAYLYKQRQSAGNRLFMGPGWNYAFAFGNGNSCQDNSIEGHVLDYNVACPNDAQLVPFWWKRFLDDPAFRQRVDARWAAVRNGVYSTQNILSYVDSLAQVLNQGAQQRNFERWPVLGGESYQQQINQLKNWITLRKEWLDTKIPRLITAAEEQFQHPVAVYPNPFHQSIRISFTAAQSGEATVRLMDRSGKLLEQSTLVVDPGSNEHELLVDALSPGMYFLQYQLNGKWVTQKVIKTD